MTQSSPDARPDGAARVPSSTYRLQLTSEFALHEAARWVPYLRCLGADWIYLSPLLQAEPGSTHGYDVIDHSRTDAARGGREGLAELADAAHGEDMGVLVDIVPNHVGVATPLLSVWWRDVLTFGRASLHAAAFDIDWEAGDGRIVIPILGDGPEELAALRVEHTDDGAEVLRYYEHALPLAPGSAPPGDSPLQVHDRQHYRLVNFRQADTDLNYRRFFAVTSLAAIRVEDRAVFAESHAEIRQWLERGWVDGLRVDHPDGLADPRGYLAALADLSGGRYTVVEKILEPFEELPLDWRCHGTTGYDALALVDRVLVDPAGDRRTARFTSWDALVHRTKRAAADGILGSEVRRLVRLLPDSGTAPVGSAAWQRRLDAVAELLACFSVYRTYQPAIDPALDAALRRARGRRPDLVAELDVIDATAHDIRTEFAFRLQQTSGSVMAKGVEDCAFYRYPGLASLTEVGDSPGSGALSPADFHRELRRRQRQWPHTMTTLSTHDTKRGEDVRARINVLSEVPGEWAAAVADWTGRLDLTDERFRHEGFPNDDFADLLLQTAVGAWPIERERLHAYAEKAARESGAHTGWIDPDAGFEQAVHELVDACYPGGPIHADLEAFADRIRGAGWSNALAAKLVQLTLPGVPDVYRGTELWRNDLVDPDNRRSFDALAPGGAAELLDRLDEGWLPEVDDSGAVKLLVTSRALRARRDRPELFTGYRALAATGPAAEHVLAFDRGGAVTAATRLPLGLSARGGWEGTRLTLPGTSYCEVLTGRVIAAEDRRGVGAAGHDGPDDAAGGVTVEVADLLARYPVALLLAAQPSPGHPHGPTSPGRMDTGEQ